MKNKSEKKIYVLMVFSALFWSGAFIAGKYSVPYIPTFTLTFLRFFYASIILYFVMKKTKIEYKLQRQHVPVFLFTGAVGMFGYHVLFFTALKYTTAINSSIIAATNPIVTTLLALLFLRDKISGKQFLGILLSFTGVVFTITGFDLGVIKNFNFNVGDIWMLGAVVAWAAYGVFSKSKGKGISPIVLTYYSFLFCTIMLVPFVIYEAPPSAIVKAPLSCHLAVLYMSIFPSVIGYLVQQMAIKKIGPQKASIFVNLVPFFSMILSVVILSEKLEPIKFFTAILIIAGVLLCQLGNEKSSEKQ